VQASIDGASMRPRDRLDRSVLTVAAVVVTIAIALLNSRKGSGRGSTRVVAGRAKG